MELSRTSTWQIEFPSSVKCITGTKLVLELLLSLFPLFFRLYNIQHRYMLGFTPVLENAWTQTSFFQYFRQFRELVVAHPVISYRELSDPWQTPCHATWSSSCSAWLNISITDKIWIDHCQITRPKTGCLLRFQLKSTLSYFHQINTSLWLRVLVPCAETLCIVLWHLRAKSIEISFSYKS